KRDELDAKIAIEGSKLGVQGAQLDQDAIQMAIDATRPEEEKSSTEQIPTPGPPRFPSLGPQDAPAAPGAPGQPGMAQAAPAAPQGPAKAFLPPKLDLPARLGQR